MKRLFSFGLAAVLATASVADAELLTWLAGDVANEADARVALDSSKNGNHAFMQQNTVLSEDGKSGGAIDFGDGDASFMKMNPSTWGRFDGINENQEFTIAFWAAQEESAVSNNDGPRNNSVFWFQSPANNGGARGIQSHLPWSNGQVYLDIGGCCSGTERVNGAIDAELWDSSQGEEWTHWAYTMDAEGNASVYADGEAVLERAGPTDVIETFQQVWFGSAVNGGNSFAGRLDDIVVADNALDFEQVGTLFADGPAAVWADDIADTVPTNILPNSEPVAELVKVAGIGSLGEIVAGDSVDGLFYEIEVSSDLLDSDHLIKFDGPLDMSASGVKIVPLGDLVAGDSWVPIVGSEVSGLDSTQVLFDDPSVWDLSSFATDGRVVFTGGAEAAAVPEPTSFALLGLGGIVLGLLRKRRR